MNNQNTTIFGVMSPNTHKVAKLLYLYFLDYIVDGNEEDYPPARSLFSNPMAFYNKYFGNPDEMERANKRYKIMTHQNQFKQKMKTIKHPNAGNIKHHETHHHESELISEDETSNFSASFYGPLYPEEEPCQLICEDGYFYLHETHTEGDFVWFGKNADESKLTASEQ